MDGLFECGQVRVLLVDGFADRAIPGRLAARGFRLYDGRTLAPYQGQFSLLAIREASDSRPMSARALSADAWHHLAPRRASGSST